MGARGSVVGWGTVLQAGRSRVRVPMRWIFFNLPILSSRPMALGSTQLLTERVPGIFLGVKGGRRVRLTTSPPSVSRLCRENVGAPKSHNPMGLHGLLQGSFYLFLPWFRSAGIEIYSRGKWVFWVLLWTPCWICIHVDNVSTSATFWPYIKRFWREYVFKFGTRYSACSKTRPSRNRY
jgi:hypothetical protein